MRLLLVTLALVALAVPARAQPPSQEEVARSHYVAGEEEYARGRWREALHEFQLGYALSPRPEFLINFAQVHRKLGDYDEAIRECERFLATSPPQQLAGQAQRLLQQLEDERARVPASQRATPPAPPAIAPTAPLPPPTSPSTMTATSTPTVVLAAPPPHRRKWVAPVIAVAVTVGAAAIVVGVVVGLGLGERDSLPTAPLGTVDFR